MEEDTGKKIKGLRIKTFNTCMIIICSILYILLICNLASIPSKYQKVIKYTDEYIVCERDAAMLYTASDYLTEQVRLYAQNMDMKYMEAYFKEANESKRREAALEELKSHNTDESVMEDLAAALQCSNELMEREIYCMRLISTANQYDEELLPEEVRSTPLKADDSKLGYDEMVEKARDLVFNEEYQNAKALIYSHLSYFLDNITEATKGHQTASIQEMKASLFNQRIFISILFAANVLTFITITILIVKPLSIQIKNIKDNSVLEIMGSYEFKYLALTYNDIYELNAANEKMLMQKAEQDALTGVMNRTAFESLKIFLKESPVPLALAVVDVDKFKVVNDNWGHETGDEVLREVALTLESSFRSGDYIIRYGGDEFMVIMMDITEEKKRVIMKKFEKVDQILANSKEGMPCVTLSVGVAFSKSGFTDDLFERADQALYEAKNHGRSRCYIFRENV